MHRFRCGVIYTNAFAAHLTALHQSQVADHFGKVLALDYMRAVTADQKAREWWRVDWVVGQVVPEEDRFLMAQVQVCMNKATRRGLKDRCLDVRDGAVVVR